MRWLGGALAIALAIALSWRAGLPRPDAKAPGPSGAGRMLEGEGPAAGPPRSDPKADPLPSPPARDIFRYAETPSSPVRRMSVEPKVEATAEPPAPPPALRLVGLVRRPEGLRAAVATASGVVIVGPGDLVLGHSVLSLDEDRGLRLRAPDGTELILAAGH